MASKRKYFNLITFICIILLITGTVSAATYSGGSGTIDDPYQLSTDSDIDTLSATSADWGMNFILTNNITLVGNHTPIGNIASSFSGSFDGSGYAITNLTIYETSNYVGFFGYALANIHDIGIETSSEGVVSVSSSAGILVGYNDGTINNSYAIGNVTGQQYVGGLVGIGTMGTINNCYSSGNVTGAYDVGGLLGSNMGAILNNCYSTGNIIGNNDNIGGLVGSSFNYVNNCFATGSIINSSESNNVGGLAGSSSAEYVINCYHSNNLADTYATSTSYDNFTNFSFVSGATGLNWNASDDVITTEDDPNFVWRIDDGLSLPYFQEHPYSGGSGTIDDPYQLSNDADIDELSATPDDWRMNFTLLNDITLVGNHTPIGTDVTKFTGNFDGNGYAIKNLTIYTINSDTGFFGHTVASTNIHDLGIETSSEGVYSTNDRVGGLVGYNYGTVSNCSVTGNVTGNDYVGCLIGRNYDGTINNSSSSGNVTSSAGDVGGLIGYNFGIIDNCSSSSTIFVKNSANYNIGGLIGYNSNNISNSYATGNVTGDNYNYAGGLIGENEAGTITNCSATGDVSGANKIGGLIGENYKTCTISNSYATGNVNNSGQYTGGLIGNLDGISSINNCSATGNVTGSSSTGGLIGATYLTESTDYGIINNCYATGTISGAYGTGGLIGMTSGNTVVTNSYATGSVSGNRFVGGFVGVNGGTVTNCYTTDNVTATSSSVGGLIGQNDGTVSNSYATSNVSGSQIVGGLVGYNNNAIKNCFATGTAINTESSVGGLVGLNIGTVNDYCYYSSIGSYSNNVGKSTSYINFTNLSFISGNSGLNWNENITTVDDSNYIWKIIDGYTLPYFQWQDTPDPLAPYVETISQDNGFYNAAGSTAVWINITGCSFNESCIVNLTMDGQDTIIGTINSNTYTTINAIFDISSAITGNWSLYVINPDSQISTAKTFTVDSLPVLSTPVLSNTTGNFYVNWTWDSIENADSYNVSLNNAWTNGTISTEINDTGLASHATSEIQVLAYNGTYGILSDTANDSVTLANNPISISGLNNIAVDESELITVNAEYSDLDEGDTATFACNRTDLFTNFNTSTGEGTWQTNYTSSGTYPVNFSVSDGYNSTASQLVTITVTNVPTTMYVGSIYDYTTIQTAVDNATDGDTIIVTDGTYNENVDVNKSVTLCSENGAENTIVNASDSSDHVFNVTASNVTIDGFNVTGATSYPAGGIYLGDSDNCTITNNIVNNNYYGIYLSSSGNNTLTSNTLTGNYHGIHLLSSSDYNTLTDNTAMNNTYGIYFSSSDNNTLTSNTASYNGRYGMYFSSSNNNILNGNVASYNTYSYIEPASMSVDSMVEPMEILSGSATGIYIVSSDNNVLTGNTANYNEGSNGVSMTSNSNAVSPNLEAGSIYSCGFSLYSSDNTTLTGNTAIGNDDYAFYSRSSLNCAIDNLEIAINSMELSFVPTWETAIENNETTSIGISDKSNVNGYVDIGLVEDMNLTIFYDDSGMSSSVESSILLYKLDGNEWFVVPNATLSTSGNSVSINLDSGVIVNTVSSIEDYTSTYGLFRNVPSSSSSDDGVRASVSQGQDPSKVSNSASSVKRVTGDSDVNYDFSDSGSPVLGVSFEAKKDKGLVVAKVQVLSSAPEGVPSPFGNSYQMMSIDVGSEGTISSDNADNIQIRFKVSKQWIEENNIDVSTIRMTRYHGEQWNDLPTYQESEDDEYIYFYAETPGFSIFEVVGDEISAGSEQAPASMSTVKEETQPVDEETKNTPGFTALAGIVFGSLALFGRRK